MALIVLYYASIVATVTVQNTTHYQLLTDAFLAGQTELLVTPSQKLLALPDPYNPKANHKYRLHDVALYDGKYYMFYGPAPAILLFLPYKWLTGKHLNTGTVVWFFSVLATLGVVLIFLKLTLHWKLYHPLFTPIGICLIAAGTFLPYVIRRPSFYEVAVTSAYAFTTAAMLALLSAFQSEKNRLPLLAVSSLCFGLAAGCRIHFGMAGGILFAVSSCLRSDSRSRFLTVCLFVPWAACIALLGWYNYIRFGSLFETGNSYQLTCQGCSLTVGAEYFFHNLYYYLLKFIPLTLQFPYLNVGCCGGLATFGIWTNAPFFSWIVFTPLLLKRAFAHNPVLHRWLLLLLTFSMAMFLFLNLLSFDAMRYRIDFTPWWMLMAVCSYITLLIDTENTPKLHRLIKIAGLLTAAYTLFVGIISGYLGEYTAIPRSLNDIWPGQPE